MTTEDFSFETVIYIRDTVARSEINYPLRKYLHFLCQSWLEIDGISDKDKDAITEILKPHLYRHLERAKYNSRYVF